MSIATLKRKTNVMYNNMSVNRPQFSLQGYYRNDRSLPSTNRIQTSIPKTLARGNTLRGHGGSNGMFRISIITPLCEQPLAEQPMTQTVKQSTKTTSGLIATKYLWTKLPNPYTWVKRQNTEMNTSSQEYIKNLTKEATKTIINTPTITSSTLNECNYRKEPKVTTSGKYILGLGGNCVNTVINDVYNLPTNKCGEPILG